MKILLRHKVIGLALLSALAPVLALLLLLHWQEGDIRSVVERQFQARVQAELGAELRGVYGMLDTANGLLQSKVDIGLNVAHELLDRAGPLSFGPETATWQAVNQNTLETQQLTIPQMKFGGAWFGQNADFATPSPVVDQVKQLVDCTCTIFQRMDDDGDMLRVATNVEKLNGQRAIGTFIPAFSNVVKTVLAGQTFRGPAYVVNAWYLSAYQPLRDASGRVVGMLYVGVKQEADTLRDAISKTKVGDSGYVWVALGKNAYNLSPFILQGGAKPTASIALYATKDDDSGQPVFPPLIDAAIKTPGEIQFAAHSWRNPKTRTTTPPTPARKSPPFITPPGTGSWG